MTFRECIAGGVIALAILLLSVPVAAVATILLMPLWTWVERELAIEAVGHSGPAVWAFLSVYSIIVLATGIAKKKRT